MEKSVISVKGLLVTVLFFVLLPVNFEAVHAETISSMSSAINKAGRQRMLTQRIVKAYIMVGMDVQADEAARQLLMSIELFEKQLGELKRYIKAQHIKKGIAKVETLWKEFRKVAIGKVSKVGVKQLLFLDDKLLAAAHAVVEKLQMEAGNQYAEIVNISGRQRMLSQRIAKFYMAAAWNVNRPDAKLKMFKARDEFSGALGKLKSASINNQGIKQALYDVELQWSVFERSFQLQGDKYVPLLIAMSSEKILTDMNEVTGMYDKLDKG